MLPIQSISFMAGAGIYDHHGVHCVAIGVTRHASLAHGEPFIHTSHWPREGLVQAMLQTVKELGWQPYIMALAGCVYVRYERPRE